jgi:PilX N-terminal
MRIPRWCRSTVCLRQESGAALTTSLVLMAVLTLLGTASIVTGVIDTKIGGNYKTSVQAFYAAETGIEEARARLRTQTVADYIDTSSTDPQWKAYIASGAYPQTAARRQAMALGYNATDHALYYSRQSTLDYTVVIEPVAGTPGRLRITSHGAMSNAKKRLQIVAVKPPAFAVPAALYVETNTRVQGITDEIIGMDSCGNDHKRGVVTTLPQIQDGLATVQQLAGPTIMGSPQDIQYSGDNLDIQSMVSTLREFANFTYTVSNATHTSSTTPGPGDHWGQPALGATPQDPSACEDYNVIHYQTGGTNIALSDRVSGCGILLVEGNLELSNGFSWYGLILVTGTVYFAGSELQQTQIRGAVLSEASIGLNLISVASHIVYCSKAVNIGSFLLRVLSWKDVYDIP